METKNLNRVLALLVILVLLAACSPAGSSTPSPAPSSGGSELGAATAVTGPGLSTAVAAAPTMPGAQPPALTAYPGSDLAESSPAPTAGPEAYPGQATQAVGVPLYSYHVLNIFPHDRTAYTQGLVVEDSSGILLESTGLWGESTLRRVNLADGSVLQSVALPDQYFGEGIARVGDRIVQVTWQSQTGFVYDRESFAVLQEFNYPHEGWGVAYDGQRLIVSDGTDKLHFWDPDSLEETGFVNVHDENGPVPMLNELEFVDGEIWANVYLTDRVARIDPQTGQVEGWIDLTGLLAPEYRDGTEDVLNGIAYDPQSDRIFVTGKRWPMLFEVEIVPAG